MDGLVEIECGKCGIYLILEVDEDRLSLVRGCHHFVVDSDLDFIRHHIMEEIRN